MYYEEISAVKQDGVDVIKILGTVTIDLRSDTLTLPTKRMREAMFKADVGDDVYEEDPTVLKLQERVAQLLGMEAALFVSSGTMGNLIAIMNHCDERGSEAYCGSESHVVEHEQGGAAQLAGVTLRLLKNHADGTFDLEDLRNSLRKDHHTEPISKLVLVENTLNGKIIPKVWIEKLIVFCKTHGLKLHLDGARLWNASVASGEPVQEMVRGFDSVTFCLSKGLGAPVGSILCGTKEFITKARRVRKALGGGMRQVGILAAAGLVALEDSILELKEDHRRTLHFATSINQLGSQFFKVDLKEVQTNMVFLKTCSESISPSMFAKRLREVRNDHNHDSVVVKCLAVSNDIVRFVFYQNINDEMMLLALNKIIHVIKSFEKDL